MTGISAGARAHGSGRQWLYVAQSGSQSQPVKQSLCKSRGSEDTAGCRLRNATAAAALGLDCASGYAGRWALVGGCALPGKWAVGSGQWAVGGTKPRLLMDGRRRTAGGLA
jgi:hypothetical protein